MAAAGTLSRPTSAQGNYSINAFQTYYAPPSPTVTHGGKYQESFALPTRSGADHISICATRKRWCQHCSRFLLDIPQAGLVETERVQAFFLDSVYGTQSAQCPDEDIRQPEWFPFS